MEKKESLKKKTMDGREEVGKITRSLEYYWQRCLNGAPVENETGVEKKKKEKRREAWSVDGNEEAVLYVRVQRLDQSVKIRYGREWNILWRKIDEAVGTD